MLSVVTLPSNNTSAKRKIAPRAASSARKVKRKTAANRGLTVQTSDCATKPKAAQDHDNDSSAGEESVKPCKQRGVHANAKAAGLGRSVEQKRKSSTGPAGRGRSLGFGKDGSLRLYMNSKRRKLFGSDSEDEESVPVALVSPHSLCFRTMTVVLTDVLYPFWCRPMPEVSLVNPYKLGDICI